MLWYTQHHMTFDPCERALLRAAICLCLHSDIISSMSIYTLLRIKYALHRTKILQRPSCGFVSRRGTSELQFWSQSHSIDLRSLSSVHRTNLWTHNKNLWLALLWPYVPPLLAQFVLYMRFHMERARDKQQPQMPNSSISRWSGYKHLSDWPTVFLCPIHILHFLIF